MDGDYSLSIERDAIFRASKNLNQNSKCKLKSLFVDIAPIAVLASLPLSAPQADPA